MVGITLYLLMLEQTEYPVILVKYVIQCVIHCIQYIEQSL